jgi:hypothetical protein
MFVGYIFLYIYIYKSESIWLAGWLGLFVCMLLGSGGLLLCSGGVFFGVGQWHNNGVAFSLRSVPRTRWWANVAFSLGSVLGLLLGNDIYIRSSCFWGGMCVCVCLFVCCYEAGQQLRVSKICESEMATKDTHLVLPSTRATPGISASLHVKL